MESCGEADFADLVGIYLNIIMSVQRFMNSKTQERRTPLRVAFAAAEALALGFLPFDLDLSSMYQYVSKHIHKYYHTQCGHWLENVAIDHILVVVHGRATVAITCSLYSTHVKLNHRSRGTHPSWSSPLWAPLLLCWIINVVGIRSSDVRAFRSLGLGALVCGLRSG